VLLGREFGWTLDEMRQLYPSELQAIIQELQRQKLLDEYTEQRNKWAFLAAVIANCTDVLARTFSGKRGRRKTVEPDDFISKDFRQVLKQLLRGTKDENAYDKHVADAQAKGLAGPW